MINFEHGISLTRITEDALPLILKWRNDRRIWKWTRQNDLIHQKDHEAWFKKQIDDPTIQMYLIEKEKERIGVCGFINIDKYNQKAEFSIYIAPDFHSKGFGKASLKTLLAHGFRNLNLNCIWGETFDGNPAAKMFENVGMKQEGKRRDFYFRDGKFIDSYLYSMLRSEWAIYV